MIKIYNKTINDNAIGVITSTVKSKKELALLDNKIIIEYAVKFLEQNTKLLDVLSSADSKDVKNNSKIKRNKLFGEMIKYIRRESRLIYGMFQKPTEINKRKDFLNELNFKLSKKENYDDTIIKLLSTHVSTNERLAIYNDVIGIIDKIIFVNKLDDKTSKNNSHKNINLLDIASGLNPIAMIALIEKYNYCKIKYIATELNKEDCDFLNDFFNIITKYYPNFNGIAYDIDLRRDYERLNCIIKENNIEINDKNINICLIFKTIEILEKYKKHFSFKIFDNIKEFNNIIVSFPLQTLANTQTTNKKRLWFEKMISKLGYEYGTIQLKNEIFYHICY